MMGNAIGMKSSQWIAIDSTGLGGLITGTAQSILDIIQSTTPSAVIPEEATAARIYVGVQGAGGYISMMENGTPTNVAGIRLSDGNIYDIEQRVNINNARFIAGSGTFPFIFIQFYK